MAPAEIDAADIETGDTQAAERIVRFTANRSFEHHLSDEMLRAAVERQFEIIGEALAGVKRQEPATAGAISDLPRIIAVRNSLIHGDASVDNRLACRRSRFGPPADGD